MPVYYGYSNAIFGTQSTVNGSPVNYAFGPTVGGTWTWTGSTTSFHVRENDGATLYNGDPSNEQVSGQEQIGGAWEQVTLIGGTYYQTIWDYTFEIEAADGTLYRVAVIDVDLNNDDDLNDAGEDGYYLVFPDGVPPAGVNYTVNGIVENDDFVPHADLGATIVCFTEGTMIETEHGPRAIETLQQGDRVLTRDDGYQPLRWIGTRRVRAEGDLAPVLFQPGTVGNDRPLLVSPLHRMLMSDWRVELLTGEPRALIAARDLVNDRDIVRQRGGWVTYVHILFDRHQIVYAEGAPSESLHPGHCALDALERESRAEVIALFPELAEDVASYGPAAATVVKGYQAACIARLAG